MAPGRRRKWTPQSPALPVVPAKALGIHKRLELRALGDVLIGRFQHPIHGPLPQALAFGFIGHPEVAGQLQEEGVLPQQVPAEGVDRGDFCQIQPLHLTLQMPVSRICSQHLHKLCTNFPPKLRRSGLGIGDDQKFIHIGRILLLAEVSHEPVYQHLGLAGSGRRRPPGGGRPGSLLPLSALLSVSQPWCFPSCSTCSQNSSPLTAR